jgi:glycosyltransferase involved in cell wall biosynthesis
VAIAAKQLAHEANLHLRLVPIGLPHDAILKLYGQARLSISIAISDGVPNSLLESMAMGTFPIQSNTSCADEWVKDGETSFLVPPDDLDKISMAIRRSLQDSTLVDNAAKQNASVIYARQNILVNQKRTVEMYESLIGKRVYAKR